MLLRYAGVVLESLGHDRTLTLCRALWLECLRSARQVQVLQVQAMQLTPACTPAKPVLSGVCLCKQVVGSWPWIKCPEAFGCRFVAITSAFL